MLLIISYTGKNIKGGFVLTFKLKAMRLRRITVLVLASLFTVSYAQLEKGEDGLYYNKKGELYTGTYVEYYPNGNKKLEMPVVEGKKQGVSTYYFDNNTKQEIRSYSNNEMDGLWETWNEKGVKVGVANYKKGKKDGKWYIYNDKGTMLYDMNYEDGKKEGIWKAFDDQGNLKSTKEY